MYAETGLLFPCFQNYSQDVQQYEDLCRAQKSNALISNLVSSGSLMISEYDLGGEGDLFKAPEAIMVDNNEPMMMSMMSSGEAMMSSREADDQLLSEVLYECEKDLLEQAAMEIPLYEQLEIKVPTVNLDEASPFQKSVSSECLSSMDWAYLPHHHGGGPALTAPLPEEEEEGLLDISARMRRAFSEGDIKTLGSGNGDANGSSAVQSPRPTMVIGKSIPEERREQLSRYRTKKSKRNFGRKIKYACRKALADSQPRIRGRFARTE